MENENLETTSQQPEDENYNPNTPQENNVPKHNSTTTSREGINLPAVENLNHEDGLDNDLKNAKKSDSAPSAPKNDEALYGENTKTDLGNGQRDEDEDENEKIIRT